MTIGTDEFLATCELAFRLSEPHRIPQIERLLRIARRAQALEQALRGDPGHDVTGAVCAPTHDRTKAVWNWERMGRALLALTGPFEPRVCRVCGCTETTACLSLTLIPCGWFDAERTLCDSPTCLEAATSAGLRRDIARFAEEAVGDQMQPALFRCINCKLTTPDPHPEECAECRGRAFVEVAQPKAEPPTFGPGRWA